MAFSRSIVALLIVSALLMSGALAYMLYDNDGIEPHGRIEIDRGAGTSADPFLIYDVADLSMVGKGAANPEGYKDWELDKSYRLVNNIIFDPNDSEHDTNGSMPMIVNISYNAGNINVAVSGPDTVTSLNVWLWTNESNGTSSAVIPAPDVPGKYTMSLGGELSDGTAFAYAFEIDTSDMDVFQKQFDGNGNFDPIGIYDPSDENKAFSGEFDGAGFVISGMNVAVFSAPNITLAGLFGYALEANITDLGMIDGSFISVAMTTASAGSIIGYAKSTIIADCYNTCDVTSSSIYYAEAGGLTGFADLTSVSNCYNAGNVTATASTGQSCAGGIMSTTTSSSAIGCYNIGDITANGTNSAYTSVGGIMANSTGLIFDCYNAGNITTNNISTVFDSVKAGGIASGSTGSIIDSYNIGDVKIFSLNSTPYVGGITGVSGQAGLIITNCYNTGNVDTMSSLESHAGGMVGDVIGSLSIGSSYFLDTSAGQIVGNGSFTVDALSGSRTSDLMKVQSTFENWDFPGTWFISPDFNSGFPILDSFIFDLVLNSSGNGSVSGPDKIYGGTDVVIAIVPGNGYSVWSIIDNGNDVTDKLSNGTYIISNIFSDREITTEFGIAIPGSDVGSLSGNDLLLIITCILLGVSIISLVLRYWRRDSYL